MSNSDQVISATLDQKNLQNEGGSDTIAKSGQQDLRLDLTEPAMVLTPTTTATASGYSLPPVGPDAFEDVGTTRCVLNELYATMDYGGLLPAIKGAYNDLNGMYATDEAFFLEWHCDMEQILAPPPPPWNDTYDTGHYMFMPPWSDGAARILQPAPLGLDMTLWQITTGAGEYVPVPSAAVDGALYEYSAIYYQDALEDTSPGSIGELRRTEIQAMITPRQAVPSPLTIAVNGTYDDGTDWGNMTATIAAIGDLPTSNIIVDFFIAEDLAPLIETRNNPIDGNAASEAWSDKYYYMNKVARRWAGLGQPNSANPFFLYNKTDTVSYIDIPFDDHWQWGGGSNGWTGSNLWLICAVSNGDTMEVLQTSTFSIGNALPDLYTTPVDIFSALVGTVANETVEGPTTAGQTGPLFLDNGNIMDLSLYVFIPGAGMIPLQDGADYTFNPVTGEIDTSPIEPFDTGWYFYAWYNHTLPPPSEGDIQDFEVTVYNTGNAAAGASTLHITDGDGGPVVDTLAVPALAAGGSTMVPWAFDTTGYPGEHTLCFIPDGPDAINEHDENNNIAVFDLYVAPPEDVATTSFDNMMDGGTYEWGANDILVTVTNLGQLPQAPFPVECVIHENTIEVYRNTQYTTFTLNQWDSEQLTWSYVFGAEGPYTITVTTLLGDTVPSNDQLAIDVNMVNSLPPGEAQHLRLAVPPVGPVSNSFTVDQDIPVEGVVTNDYTEVITPADGQTEDITETGIGGDVWLNYTVDLDLPDHGIVSGTYQDIDEIAPPDGLLEQIQEELQPGGGPMTSIYSDDCETNVWNQYVKGTSGGANPTAWARRNSFPAHSGSWLYDFGNGNYADPNPGGGLSWMISPDIVIPSGTSYAELSFWHWRDFEAANWDGGNVKISTSGTGGPFNLITPVNGYDGAIATGYENPLGGQQGFLGAANWEQDTFDLTTYAGNTVNIRWDAGVDNWATTDAGWRVDDIDVSVQGDAYSAEHRWRSQNVQAGSDTLTLHVRARVSAGADDTFTFGYATAAAGPYTPLALTVSGNTMSNYAVALPNTLSGRIYLNAVDDNPTDSTSADTLEIDLIRIQYFETSPPQYSLEHRWRTETVDVGASTLDLVVEARYNAGSDDTFTFGYSTTPGGPYTPTTLTVNSATMNTYTASLPTFLSGQFYINVIDDNTGDTGSADTVYIDEIRIDYVSNPGARANQVAGADHPVEGAVTGTYVATTSIPPDTVVQQIQEFGGGSGVIFTDDFSSNDFTTGGWTVNELTPGGTWDASTGQAVWNLIESYALGERSIVKPIDCTGASDIQVSYGWEVRDDPSNGFFGTAYTQYSDDGGGMWYDIESVTVDHTFVASGPHTLPASCNNNPNVQLKFGFDYQNANGNLNDGVTFDDIVVDYGVPYSLEHRWSVDNMADNSLARTLYVNAYTSAGSDDEFIFGWSSNLNGPYTPVIAVNAASPFTYSASIGAGFSGTLYINVVDSNTGDGVSADSVYVDMIRVESFGSPDPNDCTIRWDTSVDDGAGSHDVSGYNIYKSDQAAGGWYEGPFTMVDMVGPGTQVWADVGEGPDLVDNIWYYVEVYDPSFTGPVTGIISKFDVLPEAYNLLADGLDPLTIPIGTPMITLTGQLRDNTTLDEWDNYIIGADWYDPLSTDGANIASPDDGVWNGPYESFTLAIDTSMWGGGNHVIEVRGNSPYGWGVAGTVTVTIIAPSYDIDLTGVPPGTWVFVSFPITATGDVATVFNDASFGDGGTDWDIIQWYDNVNKVWKEYSIYKPASLNDMDIIGNTGGFWIHLTANGGDEYLSVGSGGMPGGPVAIDLYTGWNLVGYPSATPLPGDVTLPPEADLVSYYDLGSPYRITDDVPVAVLFEESHAYWVHVTADCVWTVNP